MPHSAPESGGMHALALLASGQLPDVFPFKFDHPTDAASPYSLCLAFFPEAVQLATVDFAASQEYVLPEATAAFVKTQCELCSWTRSALPEDDAVKSTFAKTWLRKTDERFRRLDSIAHLNDVDNAWLDGIVRILQLWRKFDPNNELSLQQFEQQSPESVFDALINLSPSGWSLRQRLDFLVLPYLRYVDRIDLIQTWVTGAHHLEDVADAVFAPELATALLQLCLSTPSKEWPRVQHVVENIRPKGGLDDETEALHRPVNWETLLEPTAATLAFFGDLVEAAKTARFTHFKFQQLAEWTLGDSTTQLDLLIRFLDDHKHASSQDLTTLRKTIFSRIPIDSFVAEVIRAALSASRFMFLKSYLKSEHSEILKNEVRQMVERFGTPEGTDLSLQRVLTTLELVEVAPEVTAKFERLQQLQSTFGIDPAFALTHEPMELVRYALEHGAQVYLRFTQLQTLVAGKSSGPKVAELCIEAALADDNFSAACELIDRDFIKEESSGAWLALYEVGKYVSPQWDLPRPFHILQKQQQYLSRSLSLCPEGDLVGVLRAWSVLEHEHEEAEHVEFGQESSKESSGPSLGPVTDAATDKNHQQAGNQLSNLLVSGIGWAIGANQ